MLFFVLPTCHYFLSISLFFSYFAFYPFISLIICLYYYLFSSYHINLSSCYPLSLSLYQWSFHISFPCVLCLLLSPYLPSFLIFISLFPSILPGSIFRCYSSFNSSHFCLFYCGYSMFISHVVSFLLCYTLFLSYRVSFHPFDCVIPCFIWSSSLHSFLMYSVYIL